MGRSSLIGRGCMLLILAAFAALPASAQMLTTGATAAPESGLRQEGAYVTAPITLEGATLFRIVAPANPLPGQVSIATRQLDIENALGQMVAVAGGGPQQHTLYDPQTLKIDVVTSNDQAVLEAMDAHHSTPVSIVTVTPVDAKFYGVTMTSLANRWRARLQDALRDALLKRQPQVQRRNAVNVAIAAGALAIVTLLTWLLLLAPLRRRADQLQRRLSERGSELESAAHQHRRHFLALALRAHDPVRQLVALRTLAATVIWVLLLLWFGALVWAFFLFPQTTPLAHEVLHTILAVAATWIGAGLVNRLLDLLIGRIGNALRQAPRANAEERAREMLRIPTVTRAVSGFKTVVIVFVALLITLGQIGIPVWSVVTFGGLTAIGITLAAQNLVRDFFNGFLVLTEDQYVVGDYITINGQSGIVENVTLRMAQIRDTGGNLVTIPHSAVTSVVNHSRNWSRVDYRVSVDANADTEKAIRVIREAIEAVARDPEWRDVVLGPLEWIGVDGFSRDGMTIRASLKTAPLRQFDLRRVLNARVHEALAAAGIGFGAPIPE